MGKNCILFLQKEKTIQNITVKCDRSRDHTSAEWLPTTKLKNTAEH